MSLRKRFWMQSCIQKIVAENTRDRLNVSKERAMRLGKLSITAVAVWLVGVSFAGISFANAFSVFEIAGEISSDKMFCQTSASFKDSNTSGETLVCYKNKLYLYNLRKGESLHAALDDKGHQASCACPFTTSASNDKATKSRLAKK